MMLALALLLTGTKRGGSEQPCRYSATLPVVSGLHHRGDQPSGDWPATGGYNTLPSEPATNDRDIQIQQWGLM